MKKSEVLSNIDSILEHHGFDDYENRELLSNEILNKLLNLGMCPNTIQYLSTGEFDKLSNFPGFEDYDCCIQWEDE